MARINLLLKRQTIEFWSWKCEFKEPSRKQNSGAVLEKCHRHWKLSWRLFQEFFWWVAKISICSIRNPGQEVSILQQNWDLRGDAKEKLSQKVKYAGHMWVGGVTETESESASLIDPMASFQIQYPWLRIFAFRQQRQETGELYWYIDYFFLHLFPKQYRISSVSVMFRFYYNICNLKWVQGGEGYVRPANRPLYLSGISDSYIYLCPAPLLWALRVTALSRKTEGGEFPPVLSLLSCFHGVRGDSGPLIQAQQGSLEDKLRSQLMVLATVFEDILEKVIFYLLGSKQIHVF